MKICKVLVVEDNEGVQQVLQDVFGDLGYRFTIVRDGAGMRAALAEDPDFDIVVIDVVLPGGVDGFTLAREADAQGCGVVLSTGNHEQIEALEKSGHRYILKPYRLSTFVKLVDEVLAQSTRRCRRATAREERVD
jgi:DNA-binding response OmpR family regulator